jgi:hypothetical protein
MLAIEIGPDQARFALFLSGMVLATVGGYLLRRARLVRPEWARAVMSAAIIGCDAPIALLAIWHLEVDAGVWKVPVAGAVVAVAASLGGLVVARRLRMPPADQAVFGLQSGMGNVGYTLGGALCFVLWGMQGLAREQMYCLMWPFYAFLFCFPIGRHYGDRASAEIGGAQPGPSPTEATTGPRPPPATASPREALLRYAARLMLRSLTDLRSLPLYTATLGLVLNLRGVALPPEAGRWHVIDILMVLGIFLQFGGVGMTVEARRLPRWWRPALGTALLKMGAGPLLMLAVVRAIGLEGVPLGVCLLLSAMPTALYSVLMANLFGLNRDLANAAFILTHGLCFAVLVPVVLLLAA